MHHSLLADIGLCVTAALVMALVARLLRQPPMLGYLAAGVLLGGQVGFGLIEDERRIREIAQLGLVLLLFLIGAEIDLRKLLRAGPAVIGGGLLQVPLCALCLAAMLAPFYLADGGLDLGYAALLLSLSSTAIVVKLLYERNDLDTHAGRITLGILVIQDIWAIGMLVVQPNLANPDLMQLAQSLGAGFGLVALVLAIGKFVLPRAFEPVARSGEMTLLLALTWCALACAGAHLAGLSLEMGALLAGITISSFPVSLEVVTRILSIRDFFVTLFFVTLGLTIPRPTLPVLAAAGGVALAVVASRLLVVVPLIRWFARDARTATVTALNLAQVSEFALVIGAIGLNLGHVRKETIATITIAMFLTAVLAPYLFGRSHAIHVRLALLLRKLGVRGRRRKEAQEESPAPARFLVLGCYHIGRGMVEEWLQRADARKHELHFVDFNPETLRRLQQLGLRCTFGDVSNLELLVHLHPAGSEVIVCSLPDTILKGTSNLQLFAALRRMAPRARIVMTAEREAQARDLYRAGADYVLMPHLAGGAELADLLLFTPPVPPGMAAAQRERVDRLRS